MVHESIREDFLRTISQAGYDPSDFELALDKKDPPTSISILYEVTGTYIVTRKSNGCTEEYPAFSGSTFPADFADNLQKGVFD